MKVARSEAQEARKKWGKQQAIRHTYGHDEDDDDEGVDQETVALARELVPGEGPDGCVTVISGKTCRCGSHEHKRTSNKNCPLNKKNQRNPK